MYDDKEYHKRYYQEHKKEIKARSKAYRDANKQKCSEYGKEWRKNNPMYYKQYTMGNIGKEWERYYDKRRKNNHIDN